MTRYIRDMTIPDSQIVPDDLEQLQIAPVGWQFREGQHKWAEAIAQSPKKIIMFEAECGAGKSLIPQAAAVSAGVNYQILIQTRNLQRQYLRDFPRLKLMEGRAHSRCNLNGWPADQAPCTIGMRCALKGSWRNGQPIGIPECVYFRHKAEAALAQGSILNYAYWLNETRNDSNTFGRTDWIICDEGHELDQILIDAAKISFNFADLRLLNLPTPPATVETPANFSEWLEDSDFHQHASHALNSLTNQAIERRLIPEPSAIEGGIAPGFDAADMTFSEDDGDLMRELRKAREIESRAAEANNFLRDPDEAEANWIVSRDRTEFYAKPIYGKFGFKRIKEAANLKVIIMSAFLGPDLMRRSLGLSPSEVDVIESGPVFDRTNSKIYYTPIRKFSIRTTEAEWKHVALTIDRAANTRFAKQKGLVHVPSVKLRDSILAGTRNKLRYNAYDSNTIDAYDRKYPVKDTAIEQFIQRDEQRILIGQSISTGLDLPNIPKWQIITKLWFPPITDPAIAKRRKVDETFYTHLCICQIVQAAGRVKRTPDDGGPTLILDENFGWFYQRYKDHFPKWFRQALVWKGWDEFDGLYRGMRTDAGLCGVSVK